MCWADYEYYLDAYLGGKDPLIPAQDFYFWARNAATHIMAFTGVPPEIDDTAKLCCCEVAELLWRHDHNTGADGVASERTGDLSVTYDSGEARAAVLSCRVRGCVYKYFADTGLLYRGLD